MAVKYLTIPEVAKILSVSRRTVYRYIAGGCTWDENGNPIIKNKFILLSDRLPTGEIRVSTTQLKRFMAWCKRDGTHLTCPHCGHEF